LEYGKNVLLKMSQQRNSKCYDLTSRQCIAANKRASCVVFFRLLAPYVPFNGLRTGVKKPVFDAAIGRIAGNLFPVPTDLTYYFND